MVDVLSRALRDVALDDTLLVILHLRGFGPIFQRLDHFWLHHGLMRGRGGVRRRVRVVTGAAVGEETTPAQKEDLNIPVVFVEPLTDGDDAAIAFDQVQGARRAVEHLARLGHRGIAHIAGPCGSLEAEARMRGFLEGMASCNLPETRPILSDWTAEGGYRAGLELLAEGRTTGVIAANDHTAIGVLHACRELRLRVPEDISVIGFDDIPEAAHVAPALTTLRQDFQLVGRMALRYLMGELGSGERVRTGLLRPELILRESTGPVPEPRPGHILAKEPG